MSDVAIMGAGELGGAVAHLLARKNIVRAVRLIDDSGRVAAGKALDIAQAGAVEGSTTAIDGTTDADGVAGATIVVVADRIGRGEWQGDDGLMLLKRIGQMAPSALILCAGSAHRELVERAVIELKIKRSRILGTAPEALTAAARALVALATNASPGDVALTVLGVPPSQLVIPWGEATIGGFGAVRILDEPTRRRIGSKVPALWPPGPYALAAGAVKVIEGIVGSSRRLATCFVAPDRGSGLRTRTAALPVRLGPDGIADVIVPDLSAHDRVALENAMML